MSEQHDRGCLWHQPRRPTTRRFFRKVNLNCRTVRHTKFAKMTSCLYEENERELFTRPRGKFRGRILFAVYEVSWLCQEVALLQEKYENGSTSENFVAALQQATVSLQDFCRLIPARNGVELLKCSWPHLRINSSSTKNFVGKWAIIFGQ